MVTPSVCQSLKPPWSPSGYDRAAVRVPVLRVAPGLCFDHPIAELSSSPSKSQVSL